MSMNPRNGHVKAYVGGIDFRQFQYDMVSNGRRQVGSTIKPYLYSLAMEEGLTPCSEMLHVSQRLLTEDGRVWIPRNANKKRIGEMVTLKWGLANSDNWVTAYLMGKVSPYSFVRMLRSFGIKSKLDPVVSLCLGPCEVTVEEMVSAYTTFANKGVRVQPLYVTRIEDSFGNVLANFAPQMSEVLSEESAYKMLHMLKAVIDGGTGVRMRYRYGITAPMGGKTGTTNQNADGWFMGFTPSLVSGMWVGGEDRAIHFDSTNDGQGANMALPIYANYMKKVYADRRLGYSQTENFAPSAKFSDPCAESTFRQVYDANDDVESVDADVQ
jgi:penicillin-binding protein 1A